MMLHRRVPRTPQNESVYVLNRLYYHLNDEERLKVQRYQPNNLYWLLYLIFERHFDCAFRSRGPFRNVYERDACIEELRDFARQHEMQSNWNIALVLQGKADAAFLSFLEQVLGFLEDGIPFERSE